MSAHEVRSFRRTGLPHPHPHGELVEPWAGDTRGVPPHGEVRAQRASNHEAPNSAVALSLPLAGRGQGWGGQMLRLTAKGYGSAVFLAKMDSRLRGNDTGMGSAVGPKFVPPATVIPGLDPGIQPVSPQAEPARGTGWPGQARP